MTKRVLAILCALALTIAIVPAAFAATAENGIILYANSDAGGSDEFSGANIILGNDASAWPFSTAADDGAVAFVPEKDATYRLTFNVTTTGWCDGFRVRWYKDAIEYDSHTEADAAIVNDHEKAADETATVVPAYFKNTIGENETKTYTVEFKMDGSQAAEGLIGNIAIRGQQGAHAFKFNWIKVEDASGNLLASYGDASAPTEEAAPAEETHAPVAPKTGDNGLIFLALALLSIGAVATVFISRKVKA